MRIVPKSLVTGSGRGADLRFDVVYSGANVTEAATNVTSLSDDLAGLSPGLVGADVAAIANEAALAALQSNRSIATRDDYLRALEDNILGKPTCFCGADISRTGRGDAAAA